MKLSRAERTREALLNAGYDLMLDRSFDAVAIDELIAMAGVGKGSFFNHFGDKEGFKAAVAMQVRGEIEAQVTRANCALSDPLERLAGGMREVVRYAIDNRSRTVAVLRMSVGATERDYPLNEGLRADLDACVAAGLVRPEAKQGGLLYWLGLCTVLMTHFVEHSVPVEESAQKLHDIMFLGLTGLGANEPKAEEISARSAIQLKESLVASRRRLSRTSCKKAGESKR
ncbi:MAG: TetR/AcrR family transcriptional regulator [Pseudomonadota bacterium]